jgi:hypothetical protein
MSIIVVPRMDIAEVQSYLEKQLQEDKDGDRGDFALALDLDLSRFDDRATLHGIRITDVEERNGCLGVSYTVDYHVYHGCKDIDGNGEFEYYVSGVKTSEGWEFEKYIPPDRRSTLDEF